MLDYQPLIVAPNLLAAIAVVVIGWLAFWAKPTRGINRVFFSVSVHVALWLLCLHLAQVAEDGLIWVRHACAVGAFFLIHLWLLKETIVGSNERWTVRLRRGILWVALPVPIAILPYTGWFIPPHSSDTHRIYGIGYYGYVIGAGAFYAALFQNTLVHMRRATGVTRIELQIVLLGGTTACAIVLLLMAARGYLGKSFPIPPQPIVVLIVYAGMVLAITTHRIFDARYLILLVAQRLSLVTLVSVFAICSFIVLKFLVSPMIAIVATVAASLWLASRVNSRLDEALGRYPQENRARSAVLLATRRLRDFDTLSAEFCTILMRWGSTERALLLTSTGKGFSGNQVSIDEDSPALKVLEKLRWATPERLNREKGTRLREELQQLLESYELGAMVFVRGPSLAVVAGVGRRPSRKPFTYPDIVQLQHLASNMESSLAQTHLMAKAQRAEQLATVGLLGASVAHEIRNPLVTIKSFVHLLPQHYDDRVFRERFFRLISEEVGRIDRLTEQLLDLASPRHYNPVPTSLHQVISSSLDLVATKAEERRTVLHRDLQASPDVIFTDENAARQVLLNLCFNGIQAQEQQSGERWLRLTTRNVNRGVELCVADNGPGIAPEARVHLFQAFHSTKSSGFGLGLAICNEILTSLDATIDVDPYVEGQGAVFRIVFPCPQPTS